jgi:hypothetical protein
MRPSPLVSIDENVPLPPDIDRVSDGEVEDGELEGELPCEGVVDCGDVDCGEVVCGDEDCGEVDCCEDGVL